MHADVLKRIISFSAAEGYICKGLSFSPITGGDGNIEFLLHLHWSGEGQEGQELPEEEIIRVVEEAHKTLKEKSRCTGIIGRYYSFFCIHVQFGENHIT